MAKFKVYDKYDCLIRSFHSYEAAFNFLTINQRYNWTSELLPPKGRSFLLHRNGLH